MREEIWRKVHLSPHYEVSNLGRFRSIDHTVEREGYKSSFKGQEVNPFKVKGTGYLQVKIASKKYSAHRLVAIAFCEGNSEGFVVNHKNGKRDDNRAENLEWVSQSENVKHGYSHNRRTPTSLGKFSGEHPTSKDVISTDMITGEERHYEAAMDAVREGFDSSAISRCCHGEAKYHKGKYWRFASTKEGGHDTKA